jgi:hypothetical protein
VTSFPLRVVLVHAIRRGPASPTCTVRGGVEGQAVQMPRWPEFETIGLVTRLASRRSGPWQADMHCPKDLAGCGSWRATSLWAGELDIRQHLSLCFPLTPTIYTSSLTTQHTLARRNGRKHASRSTLTTTLTGIIGIQVATIPRPLRSATAGRAVTPFEHSYNHSV